MKKPFEVLVWRKLAEACFVRDIKEAQESPSGGGNRFHDANRAMPHESIPKLSWQAIEGDRCGVLFDAVQ